VSLRAVAVDWSGRKTGERSVICLAEARAGRLLSVQAGFTREEVIAHLIEMKSGDPNLVVGFDFSFSLPGWFVTDQGCKSAVDFWPVAAERGEQWLDQCVDPFWGRPGKKKPAADPERSQLRETDIATASASAQTPRSPFQVSGAGSVGSSTLRGIPFLPELRAAGFKIWPWDDATPPAAVEIWTRVAIGDTVKSNQTARTEAVRSQKGIPSALRAAASASEDLFDAAMTALWLSENESALASTRKSRRKADVLEGRTWLPPRP
jgi:hypothetical protein